MIGTTDWCRRGVAVEITQQDETDLEWFFRARGDFQRSTSGPMFSRAALLTTGSDGQRIGAFEPNWHWRPNGEDQTLEVHDDGRGEVGYTPQTERYLRFGRLERILLEVRRHDLLLYGVLEAYYGERGNRWREAAADRFDSAGRPERKGYGPGAIASVYICTQRGMDFLCSESKRLGNQEHRRHDEVLEVVLVAQAVRPQPRVQARLDKVRNEAEALLLSARKAYLRAMTKVDGAPRKPPRMPPAKVRVSRGGELVEAR